METVTMKRIQEIDNEIDSKRSLLQGILPIFIQVDRKKKHLELDINQLEREKQRLLDSQNSFTFDLDF